LLFVDRPLGAHGLAVEGGAMSIVVVLDFDQTICDTSSIEHLRNKWDWDGCVRRGAKLPFYEGLPEAVAALKDAGMVVGIASNSQRDPYLDSFVARLEEEAGVELDFVCGFREGAALEPLRGTYGKSLIKAAQLAEIKRQYPHHKVVMVGDDDQWASKVVGVPFAHACWDGDDCDTWPQAHLARPKNLTPMRMRMLAREHVNPYVAPPVPTRRAGGFTWAHETLKDAGVPAAFLDFYHKWPFYEPFRESHDAMERFKNGDEDVAEVFRRAIAVVAREFSTVRFDVVVPVIGSKAERVERGTPVHGLARAVSAVLGKPVERDLFEQDPRESLSGGSPIGFEERYRRVYENLSFAGDDEGQRILLVDDVITTGATVKAYADRAKENGARVVGIVGVMKTGQCEPLLNPDLYGDIAA
jgi:predicted amidophosphoribosyltransferase